MKKIISLVSAVALATTLGLAGCKKDKKEGDTAATPPKTEEPKTDTMTPPKTDTPPPVDPPKTDTPPAGGTAASTGMPECDEYVAAVEKYAACDKLPAASKDATLKGVETMKATWTANMPDDAKKAAAGACKAGLDAMKQGAQALGCTI